MSDNDLTAAYLRELLEKEGIDIPIEAVEMERERLLHYLDVVEAIERYTDVDPDDLEYVQEQKRRGRSESTNKAVEQDDITRLASIKGVTRDNRVQATGYQKLQSLMRPAAQQVLIKGPKGSGKTVKANDIAMRLLDAGIIDSVMLNIKTDGLDDDKEIEHKHDVYFAEKISRFLEYAKQPGEKLAVIDELSTVGNLLTGNNDAQEIFTRVINALRKSAEGSLRLIIIGHQHDTDILPTLRSNSDVLIQADGKIKENKIDKATIYTSSGDYNAFTAYKKGEYDFKIEGLLDIPDDSPWHTDTNYFSHLEFNLDNPDQQIQRGQLIEDWEKYQETTEDDSEESENPEEVLEKLADDSCTECGQPTYKGFEYCEPHLRKALNSGEFDDVLDEDDEKGTNECRVCNRTVGISSEGFCPSHDEDDLN